MNSAICRLLADVCALVVLTGVAPASGGVWLNEIVAANKDGLADEDLDTPDWIELHNSGPQPVPLLGWRLTDDATRPARWKFPAVTLPAGGYLVVFASGKDRNPLTGPLHADFKLSSEGEYLALSNAAGMLVDEMAPAFPAQGSNVSWGRLPGGSAQTRGYFCEPTPGAANAMASLAADPPLIEEASRTFTGTLSVKISAAAPGAVIYYTTNGSLPSIGTAKIYTAPVPLTTGTRLRAIASAPGRQVSPVVSETYLCLGAGAPAANSNLPLMIVDNFGRGRPDTEKNAVWMIFEPAAKGGRAVLTAAPALAVPAVIKVRGSSTEDANKYSLAVAVEDETGGDRDVSPAGLPAESDWVLSAPYEYDRALIRNPLLYQLSNDGGRYAPRTRQVELFLNTGDGLVTSSDYAGVYTLTERIERGRDRVDVEDIDARDNSPPAVSGGYLFKIDRPDPGDSGFFAGGQEMYYVHPDEDDMTAAQAAYLSGYLNEWWEALNAGDFHQPASGYARYGDPDSFVDHHLLNVAVKNVDAFRYSAYFSKERAGRITAGPLWDFDRSLDSMDPRDNNFNTWRGETTDPGTDFFRYRWYAEMFRDQNFWQRWIDRLAELRAGPLSDANVLATVDGMAAELSEAAPRNFTRWNDKPPRFGGWTGEISHLKNWFVNRLRWMDGQFTRPPEANAASGPAVPGFALTLTSPSLTRSGARIYYTTDGRDPRQFDETTGQQIVTQHFIAPNSPVKVMLPTSDPGPGWRDGSNYDDSVWWSGVQGVGYDDYPNYESYIGFNLEAPPPERQMRGMRQCCYLRLPFQASAKQIGELTFLKLRLRCDDGMAAWLNGHALPSIKAPTPLQWDSGATTNTLDAVAAQFTDFVLTNPQTLLREGLNVLAIHGMNFGINSSDFLIQCELSGGYSPPDAPEIGAHAIEYTGPVTIQQSTHIIARTFDPAGPFAPWPYSGAGSGQTPAGSHWSAPLRLSLLTGTVPPAPQNLTITEVMYHPGPLSTAERAEGFDDRSDFEYVVVTNTGSAPVNLIGVRFTAGIEFAMRPAPCAVLNAGASGILVRNSTAFALRWGTGLPVIGEYRGKLENAGEALTMVDSAGAVICSMAWDDAAPWPEAADGTGYSLVRRNPAPAGGGTAAQWRLSLDPGGEVPGRPPLTFAQWQSLYLGGLPAAHWQAMADSDGDGQCNAAEFAAATHPLTTNAPASPVFRPAGNQRRIEVRHRPGAGDAVLEYSYDLDRWMPSSASMSTYPNSEGGETVSFLLNGGPRRAVWRVRFVLP